MGTFAPLMVTICLNPWSFIARARGLSLIVSSRLRNGWTDDPLQGVDFWDSLARVTRVGRVILTREIPSNTWSKAFGEILVLLHVNTGVMLETRHIQAQPDQDRSCQ